MFRTIIALVIAMTLIGCSRHEMQSAQSKAAGDTLWLTPEMNARVPVITVSEAPAMKEISLSGRVEFDPTSFTHVYPLVNGVYDHIYVVQGARVTKGQVLADVYSADIASTVSDFRKAKASLAQAERTLDRNKQLFARDLEAKQDLELSESAVKQAQAEYDRAEHALKILGASDKATSPIFQIVAPITGIVVESFAQPGMQVRNDGSTIAFTVGNTSSLWITLDAYADQLKSIAVGDSVIIHAAGLEDHPFATTVDYINSVVDPTTYTTKVRCRLPNDSGMLRPQLFVAATLLHSAGAGLYIPASATFLDANGSYYAFARTGRREYRKVKLQIGQASGQEVNVLGGLRVGDTIACDNALFLNDELASDQK